MHRRPRQGTTTGSHRHRTVGLSNNNPQPRSGLFHPPHHPLTNTRITALTTGTRFRPRRRRARHRRRHQRRHHINITRFRFRLLMGHHNRHLRTSSQRHTRLSRRIRHGRRQTNRRQQPRRQRNGTRGCTPAILPRHTHKLFRQQIRVTRDHHCQRRGRQMFKRNRRRSHTTRAFRVHTRKRPNRTTSGY